MSPTKPPATVTKWIPRKYFPPDVIQYCADAQIQLETVVGKHGNDYGVTFPATSQAARSTTALLGYALNFKQVLGYNGDPSYAGRYQPVNYTPQGLLLTSNATYAIQSMLVWDKSRQEVLDLIDAAQALSPMADLTAWRRLVTDWKFTTPQP